MSKAQRIMREDVVAVPSADGPSADGLVRRVGERIRSLREASGLTRVQLALRSGMSEASVRDIEMGKRHCPRIESLNQLLDALHGVIFVARADRERLIREVAEVGRLRDAERRRGDGDGVGDNRDGHEEVSW